jgi:hypothetical protein
VAVCLSRRDLIRKCKGRVALVLINAGIDAKTVTPITAIAKISIIEVIIKIML